MGEVFDGKWNERDVAIKTFKGHDVFDRESAFGQELCQART